MAHHRIDYIAVLPPQPNTTPDGIRQIGAVRCHHLVLVIVDSICPRGYAGFLVEWWLLLCSQLFYGDHETTSPCEAREIAKAELRPVETIVPFLEPPLCFPVNASCLAWVHHASLVPYDL